MSGKTNSADNVTHRRNNSNNSVFREAQTDLLHPFQGHHYDLLGGNPPPHNPDFVAQHSQRHSNPPPHNPDFVPTSDSQRTNLPLTRSELSMLAGSFSASPAVRRVSHNPFEETRSSNPFEAAVSQDPVLLAPPPRATVVHEHNPSGAFSSSSSSSSTSVPVASVVAISEDEEDTAIPFVSAMRIDEEEQETSLEREHSARSSTSSSSSQHIAAPGPAVRAAHPRDQIRVQPSPRERPPPLVFHPRAHQDPEWLGRQQQQQQRQSAPNARQHRKSNSIGTAIRRHSYTNWSRISVQAEAAVRETKRSLKKAIGREAKKLKKSIGKETKVLRRAIREDMDRMAAVRHSSCRRR
eukprot:CAMPEP_0116142838 /NCGR_PEP_ID=MMETSP0329-20121206/15121_1 /TAXON_ID=697910 /ORGANISM="Pseudo-nitzschia arenysensis, Strain B593" /LENGTH=351 /DNA_ID=CAMNT_0003638099 /DNA_START=88 /DNA_END=1143 /DNA_ORIENTATION=-